MTFQSPSSGLAAPAAYASIVTPFTSYRVRASAVAVNDVAFARLARYAVSTSAPAPTQAIWVETSGPILIEAPVTVAGPV